MSSGGFTFGGGGGFQFGASNPASTNTATTLAGSLFSMPSTQPTTASSGFSFSSSGFGGNVSRAGGGLEGFSFGAANMSAASTTTAAAVVPPTATTGGLSFGMNNTKPSGLSLSGFGSSLVGNAAKATTTTAVGLSFGGGSLLGSAPPSTMTTMSNAALTSAGYSFGSGLGTVATTTAASATTQASFSGYKLGGAVTAAAPVAASAGPPTIAATIAVAAATQSGSLLSGLLGSKPTTAASGLNLGGGFGAVASTAAAATTAATAQAINANASSSSSSLAPGFTLGGGGASTAPTGGFSLSSSSLSASTSVTTTSGFTLTFASSSVSVPAPTSGSLVTVTSPASTASIAPSLNYRQLEEAINKWTQELEEQEAMFLEQATQVNAWDRLLIENGDMITHLSQDVERVKADEQRLDQELDFILAQQSEFEDLLKPLELALEQLPPITYQQHADLEREHMFKLAENVDSQLKRMASDLKEIVEHLNAGTTSTLENSDPLMQVAKILNAHVDSLHWIDQKTGALQRRVEDVARLSSMQRKQQTYR